MGGKWRKPMSRKGRRNIKEGVRRYWEQKLGKTSTHKVVVVELNEKEIIHLMRKGVLKATLA